MANIVVKKHAEDQNKIEFHGTIVGRRSSGVLTSMTMRITTKHGNRTYTNYPSIAVFDQALRMKADTVPLRVPVVVEGYITSKKMTDEEQKRNAALGRPLQSFTLTNIRLANEDEEKNLNEVTIVGTVTDAYFTRGRVAHFIIATFRDDGGKDYLKKIKVDLFPGTDKEYDYPSIMARDTRIKIKGHCSTVTRDTDNGNKTFEYIIADSVENI